MAKPISQLTAATEIQDSDLFVLEQSGNAKKLTGALLKSYLVDNLASPFDSTASYSEGDFCIYEGKLYVANTDITAGDWDSTEWDETTLEELLELAVNTYTDPNSDGNIVIG